MNSNSLYITTNRIVLKSDPNNPSTWQDLYRLAPKLRNSLCCVVCGNLLTDPQTPTKGKCQHHLCRQCKDGTKKIDPACFWCNDCKEYSENKTLQILLQCYKKMCEMLINCGILRQLVEQASQSNVASGGAGNLIKLIKEGVAFQDDHQINVGLLRSVYSSLPCTYPTSSTQTLQLNPTDRSRGILLNSNLCNVTSDNALYSVMHTGSDNKITIQQKPNESTTDNETFIRSPATTDCWNKKRHNIRIINKHPTDKTKSILLNSYVHNVTNGNTLHSVMCAGSDTKITMEQKPKQSTTDNETFISLPATTDCLKKSIFKKRHNIRILKKYPTDETRSILLNSNVHNVTNGNTLHSVMCAGSDTKITMEQKRKQSTTDNETFISTPATTDCLKKSTFKKPRNIRILKKYPTDKSRSILLNSNLRNVTSGSTLHSVMSAGSDNKITMEQKPKQSTTDNETFISTPATTDCLKKSTFKKPRNIRILKKYPTDKSRSILLNSNLRNVTSGSTLHLVMSAGSDNKITMEQKPKQSTTDNETFISTPATTDCLKKSTFKKPRNLRILKKYPTDKSRNILLNSNLRNVISGSTLHSVMSAGSDNKITMEQKRKESTTDNKILIRLPATTLNKSVLEKRILKPCQPRRGCCCGKAAFTPGKLSCCGWRCPCYAKCKPVMECKCRRCKNPHRPEGNKVRPHTPHMEIFHPTTLAVSGQEQQQLRKQSLLENDKVELVPSRNMEQLDEPLMGGNTEIFDPTTVAVSGQEQQQLQNQSLLENDKVELDPTLNIEQLEEFLMGGNNEIFNPTTLAVSGQEQQQLQKQSLLENDNVELINTLINELLDEFLMGGSTEIVDHTTSAVSEHEQQQLRKQSLLKNVKVEPVPTLTMEQLNEHLMVGNSEVSDSYTDADIIASRYISTRW